MKKLLLTCTSLLIFFISYAQVAINDDGTTADSSAMLDIKSTNKGLLVPRLTTRQQIDISSPAAGLIIFNTDSADFYGFTGTTWQSFKNQAHTIDDWECGWPITDPRDSQTYETVDINGQCWMAENLNVGAMITGTAGDNGLIEKFCYFNNASYCNTYGGLYEWPEMMQYSTDTLVQGICPPGWHVPTEYEWCSMTTFVDPTVACGVYSWTGTDIGTKLKSTTGWEYNGNGTDAVGFNGLPGGIRTNYGNYYDILNLGYWWSSQPAGGNAWNRRIASLQDDMGSFHNTQTYATSVRCVRD